MAKKGWKLYVEEDLIADYESAAEDYERRTANEVAAEVLDTYLPFWKQAEEAKRAIIAGQQQQAGLTDGSLKTTGGVYHRGRGNKGEIGKVTKDAQSRRPKK
jgi:hypothetical protein